MRIDPNQIEKLAKKLGLKTEQISADEVIIKTANKDIIIKKPQITKMIFAGQETFQISGEVQEGIKEEDIALVMQKTGVSREEAEKALKKEGDIAKAIISLKK
ncbi:MAG: nascent polypeptide-associated complex protein [Candidatus Aenigmatarchaeota archaeon]